MLSQTRNDLQTTGHRLNQRIGARDALQKRVDGLEVEIKALDEQILATEKAVWLLQQYGEAQQKTVTARIEAIITKGLRAVFQNPTLDFKLVYSETKKGEKKKTPEVTMSIWYEHNGERVQGNLKSSFGGGLSVVASVLLRVVVLLHMQHRVRPTLILDEPLRDLSPSYGSGDVSDGYRERMADFLRTLVDETDLQVILVSHEPEYGRIADVHHKFKGEVGRQTSVTTEYPWQAELEELQ